MTAGYQSNSDSYTTIDPSHKSNNILDKYPTAHYFVVHCGICVKCRLGPAGLFRDDSPLRHSVVLFVITFLDSSHGLSNVIRAHAYWGCAPSSNDYISSVIV